MDSLLQETMEREVRCFSTLASAVSAHVLSAVQRDEFIFGDKRKVPTKVPHTKGKAHGISKYDMQVLGWSVCLGAHAKLCLILAVWLSWWAMYSVQSAST